MLHFYFFANSTTIIIKDDFSVNDAGGLEETIRALLVGVEPMTF